MKRVVSLLLSLLLVANIAFARNFFDERYFDIRVDVPLGISNNVFALNDIMVKDLVIDLPKINEDVPKETGLTTIIRADPNVSTTLRLPKFSIGVDVGADIYAKFGISKGLFDFLGKGYKIGDTFDISLVDPIVDAFAYLNVPISVKVGKFTFGLTPSTFLSVIAMKDTNTSGSVVNDNEGNVIIDVKNNMNFYTIPAIGANFAGDSGANLDTSGSFAKYLGFDLGASVAYRFNKMFNIRGDIRFPIVPSRLDTNMNIKNSYNLEGNIMGMVLDGKEPVQTPFASEVSVSILGSPVKINRPLKFGAYADCKLLGFLEFTGGGGLGIRRPGGNDFYIYPEYYLSAGVNLINLLKLSASMEYTDQVFKNALTFVLNLRILEIDAGLAFESSNFVKSFTGAGVGGYVGFAIGF